MKKTGKHIITFILFSLPLLLFGQEANFYASVDKNPVSLNDAFRLNLVIENGRGEIFQPDISDFNVVFGPAKSNSYRIINGRQSSTFSLTYTLKPKKLGTFTIPSVEAEINGKTMSTDPISIEVIKGSSRKPAATNSQNTNTSTASENENLLVRMLLSKSTVYQGESLTLTYVLYSRYSNIELGDVEFPTLTGFWSENIKTENTTWESQMELINGVPYRKAVIRRQILFPQRSGKIEIDPMSLNARVNRSFFNSGSAVKAISNSPMVTVKPLPQPAPEGFNGAVGSFDVSVEVDRTKLKANEAANLTLKVSGQGNLKLVNDPEIEFPQDFEVYDPEVNDRINIHAGGTSGSRIFQYLIIPRYNGDYTIEPIKFVYFDPGAAKYKTYTSNTFNFTVEGSSDGNAMYTDQRNKSTVTINENDIRYIKDNGESLRKKGSWFFASTEFYSLLLAAPLGFLILIIFRKRREKQNSNVLVSKNRKANKIARNRLKAAEKALANSDSKRFYEEVFKAIYGYLSDKLYIAITDLSREKISHRLSQVNVPEEEQSNLFRILDNCEMARFGPVEVKSERQFYENTVALISKLEAKIK